MVGGGKGWHPSGPRRRGIVLMRLIAAV